MTARTPTYLKSVFESGDIPSGSDYSDVFDSFLPLTTTGKQTLDISLEITGDFTAADIYGNNIYAVSAINAVIVSASVGNYNRINANFVSASGGLFNVIEAQKVSASVMNTNIINAQRVSASAMNVTDVYKVDGTQVLSNQASGVVEVSGGATVDAEARTAINSIISRLRTHGIIAS